MDIKKSIKKLPEGPGVYLFVGKGKKILYIGKATSLRSRVRSYFTGDLEEKRGPLVAKIPGEVRKIDFVKTDSVLEALILEANLIKKHLPPYNTAQKDQKSWNYVVITDEDFPRVLVVREKELKTRQNNVGPVENLKLKISDSFGPFPHGGELREAMKIMRRIFPYRDKCEARQGRPCFNRQIGLCPGVCTGEISAKEYKKTIRNIKTFFQGKTKKLVRSLEKEMKAAAQKREFEKANQIKHQISALKHINDISLLKSEIYLSADEAGNLKSNFRIEAYDISHISGTNMVGVMVIVKDGETQKSEYRAFNIRNQNKPDDIKALREVLRRRLKHHEWPYPNLLVMDGGAAQLSAAGAELWNAGLKIPVISVVKDERHKQKEILNPKHEIRNEELIQKYKREILLANSEAHRFAIRLTRKKFGKIK